MDEKKDWKAYLTDRQLKEVELARVYARDFAHGTTGHNALLIIAMLADMLDGQYPEGDES